jgi:ABC-type sugar transport system ATPase subunit
MAELLRAIEVSKRFPGVLALDRVSFELRAGEVHALVGENGAGKSTLVNIFAGSLHPDGGTIELEGRPDAASGRPTMLKSWGSALSSST